ncbi:MAG TPA: class I SAM-dependent methyltransferase [Bryobacteraceae bacterium]|nr:class I SAM-dependent methyltransferase [Bryobacteraceae bacterium]
MDPYSAYDSFAWYYRRGWGDDYHRNARPVFETHVFPRLPKHAKVLDLCCGSGDFSAQLVECGYCVTGVEGSSRMLDYARQKAPGATFLHRDARCFDLPPEFDAAFSTFDSLNHILELPELSSAFANVFRALKQGGLFVFDLNMEENFQSYWHGAWANVQDAEVGITRGSYDSNAQLARADITVFGLEPDGSWSRADTAVFERCYAEEDILSSLSAAGFSDVTAHQAWELGMKDLAIGRTFFFATK